MTRAWPEGTLTVMVLMFRLEHHGPQRTGGHAAPPNRPEATMTSAAPEDSFMEELCSLEVRWIFPGQLDAAVARWFSVWQPETESREDAYLLDPELDGLSVKVRAGRALEIKQLLGSPGILDLPGRVQGRMQHWRKWSFPFRPPGQDMRDLSGWRRVRKQRRVIRFSLAGEARCAVELTALSTGHQDWWSLGLEATGPAGSLRYGLEATSALVFTQTLPGGVDLRVVDSRSYLDWLRSYSPAGGETPPARRGQDQSTWRRTGSADGET